MPNALSSPDTLFLLSPGFPDGLAGTPYYCPQCLIFDGLLSCYPDLLGGLRVRRIGFERPRPEIVSILDPEFQSCPLLVFGELPAAPWNGFAVQANRGSYFLNDPEQIGNYLSQRYGTPRPH